MILSILAFAKLSAGMPSYRNIKIIKSDMYDNMQTFAIETAKIGFYLFSKNSEIAGYITNKLKGKYSGNWNCFIIEPDGGYGFDIQYASNTYLYFNNDKYTIVLWKNP